MSQECSVFEKCKMIATAVEGPCAVLSVKKDDYDNCLEVRLFATNGEFSFTGENIEGERYDKFLPKTPEFESMCMGSAFDGKRYHNIIDMTKTVGSWCDSVIIPLNISEGKNIGYCQFIYELDEDMDIGDFSITSSRVAGFLLKSFMLLRQDDDYNSNLDRVLSNARDFTDAASALVVLLDKTKKRATIVSESLRPGVIGADQIFTDVPYRVADIWDGLIGDNDCFLVRDLSEFDPIEKASPFWAEKLKSANAKRLCLVPLRQRRETMGYLLFTNYSEEVTPQITEILETLALILSSDTANHLFLKRLEWLTSVDLLTGVGNRSTMNRVVDEYAERLKWQKSPFGVVFCTMNGLTYLNEKNGHDEGNKCLAEAGNILRDIFEETAVFRSAGEEFAIVCENADKLEFEQNVQKLRERGSDPEGVYFAIGACFDESEGDLRKALRVAYKQMLDEKKQFYEKYPEKKMA
ncbi:MAG: GGDEF domain-containing protein [Butyrivibrio sp.]|nr:GGDEF domain-containing protein [Butyrivibrio sp.]